jgi:hypothetical protein
MSREGDTIALSETVALHGSVTFVMEMAVVELQSPAEDADVDGDERHVHDVHPTVCTAEDEQQQPLRHKFVPQSLPDTHVSPGEERRHEPTIAHDVQLSFFAVAVQQ